MKLIVITTPDFFEGENRIIAALFEEGMEKLHLRKPQSTRKKMEALIKTIPHAWYSRIVLHDHFELAKDYQLAGIHLNSRNTVIPEGFKGSISRSCHSLQEIQDYCRFDYVFLSPVFQSISKEGYGSGFSSEVLKKAASAGVINQKVIALGGLSEKTIPAIAGLGFGGVAVLGALWGVKPKLSPVNLIINRYKEIQACL